VTGRTGPARRQEQIAEYVLSRGSVAASDLAELFEVSLMTVHRDLDELERQGIVRKFRGGVTAQPSSVFESNSAYRKGVQREEKRAVGAAARKLVEPGMAIMLDDATTTLALAELLGDVGPLTVVTNYLEIIRLASGMPEIRLMALGGEYSRTHDSFLGVPCIEAIEALRVDQLYVSTSAVTDGVAYHQEQEVVLVKRAMMRSARERILMIDHTKLQRTALHALAPLGEFGKVIVDERVSPAALAELRDRHDNVTVASI
jgi:DeoR/GlpR family transcriptional regulator of sugar metabolism